MTESLGLLYRLAENLDAVLIWSLVAITLMTMVLQGSQGLGLSRLRLPFLFGTFVTADRGRAVVIGSLMHLMGGWAFEVFYSFIFVSLGIATWWVGALLGALHGLFLLVSLQSMAMIHAYSDGSQPGIPGSSAILVQRDGAVAPCRHGRLTQRPGRGCAAGRI